MVDFSVLLLGAIMWLGMVYMMHTILKAITICQVFSEIDDLREEASSLVDTLQSLERKEDLKLATLDKIGKATLLHNLEAGGGLSSDASHEKSSPDIKHVVKHFKAWDSYGRGITQEVLKAVKEVYNRVSKLRLDGKGKGDELAATLPQIYTVNKKITPMFVSKVDDMNKALSSMQEAQLSLEKKQDAVTIRIEGFFRSVRSAMENKIVDENLPTEEDVSMV